VILHTLNASPTSAACRDCLALLQADDALVLMGDGVYAVLEGSAGCEELAALGIEVFVLAADARLRGVAISAPAVKAIDMEGLVELTEQYPRQQAWY
jgi:tRNA 2-thiouridine synthesizing protein B